MNKSLLIAVLVTVGLVACSKPETPPAAKAAAEAAKEAAGKAADAAKEAMKDSAEAAKQAGTAAVEATKAAGDDIGSAVLDWHGSGLLLRKVER